MNTNIKHVIQKPNNEDSDLNNTKPYVAIGFSKDLSLTVHKTTFDKLFIIGIILAGVAVITTIGLTIFFSLQQTNLPTPDQLLASSPIFQQTGDEPMITFTNRNSPEIYIEKNPSIESHDGKYFPVGIPDESLLSISTIENLIADGKFVSENSCSKMCDKNGECNGFIYHSNNSCVLLKDDVIAYNSIKYVDDASSTLYMKSSRNLHFVNKIFLGKNLSSFPSRFWLTKQTKEYIQLSINEMGKISFFPKYSKIYGTHTGIYCLHPFSNEDIYNVLRNGEPDDTFYVHHPETNINLPNNWNHNKILYVIYL